ncbi:right-handed parallel beta-helix repeat-containing protein [Halorussus salilacus]|uniref:right-handed parallel beta-helix repeat-containing protein n=1 Tax=Halorussus salilacus TaxID=2953750 RepID=UPI00209E97D2|nr:right-handed parallel beta-helix repeat-containing protein [Halorussus salilacus]USZ68089.1 right-handed parallel beta-helix repeat-containing protein [Halorussus salilacus]
MARDKTARENDSEQSLLDRRAYLKMAGAAAASVAAVGATTSRVDAADYETIEVPAGSRETIRIGGGETFENKLIDISADGAHFRVVTSGSGWTIRNVGVKGQNSDTSDTYSCFALQCDSGGEGLVENLYMGDGSVDRCGHAAIGGYGNAGHVTLRNVHVQGWGADGIYLSQPGVEGNSGGTFTVENAFAKNNNIENIRIGTTGSVIRDSVVHVEGTDPVPSNESGQKAPRGVWLKEQSGLEVENCDIKVSGADAVFANDGGSGTLTDCRVDGSISGDVQTQNVTEGADVTPPEGVPMSAEEAASGGTSEGSSSDEPQTTEESDDEEDSEGDLLELVSGEDTSGVRYEFTVEGSVEKHESGDNAAESSDEITENGDGTVTVSGVAGNGYGDAFYVNGAVTAMDLDESDWTLRYDGEEVSVDELTLPKKLVIDGSNRPNAVSTYTFEVSGKARKSADIGSINDYDTVEDGTISGRVVGGKDGYRFSGDVTGFELDGPANVRVEDDS